MRLPTPVDPVKVMASMSAWFTIASPTAELPIVRLRTPSGNPAALSASASRIASSGTALAGFHTTVLPYTRAGAIFQAGMAMGKLNGVITATTPTGLRVTRICSPARGEAKISPACRSPSAE